MLARIPAAAGRFLRRIATEGLSRMSDHHADRPVAEPVDTPVSLSHFVHTISAYMPAIAVSLLALSQPDYGRERGNCEDTSDHAALDSARPCKVPGSRAQ